MDNKEGIYMRDVFNAFDYEEHAYSTLKVEDKTVSNAFNEKDVMIKYLLTITESIEEGIKKSIEYVNFSSYKKIELLQNAVEFFNDHGLNHIKQTIELIRTRMYSKAVYERIVVKLEAYLKITDLKHVEIELNDERLERLINWTKEVSIRIKKDIENQDHQTQKVHRRIPVNFDVNYRGNITNSDVFRVKTA